jgi:hypothetical protein
MVDLQSVVVMLLLLRVVDYSIISLRTVVSIWVSSLVSTTRLERIALKNDRRATVVSRVAP